jgi:hypothetical protein
MTPGRYLIGVIALTLAATFNALAGAAPGADASLRADLQRIAQQRIYLGHQSVGGNLLDGIRELATQAGVPIHIAEATTAGGVGVATLGHTFIAENRNPVGKLQAFDQAMGRGPTGLNVALMKFCYLDIAPDTDAKALFSRYRATIDGIRARNPGTTIVHVTAPLTEVQTGPKAFLKRLLGRPPYGALENLHREEYNALLRQTYGGHEPVFDLARLESTAPDGKTVTAEWQGRVAPAIAPLYTDDGGHLNEAGRLRAARELVSVLAAIPAR